MHITDRVVILNSAWLEDSPSMSTSDDCYVRMYFPSTHTRFDSCVPMKQSWKFALDVPSCWLKGHLSSSSFRTFPTPPWLWSWRNLFSFYGSSYCSRVRGCGYLSYCCCCFRILLHVCSSSVRCCEVFFNSATEANTFNRRFPSRSDMGRCRCSLWV